MVERVVWDHEVQGSNPCTPTNFMLSSTRGRLPVVDKEGLQDRADISWVRDPTAGPIYALLVKWYNTCFVIRIWQFDSVKGHQSFYPKDYTIIVAFDIVVSS